MGSRSPFARFPTVLAMPLHCPHQGTRIGYRIALLLLVAGRILAQEAPAPDVPDAHPRTAPAGDTAEAPTAWEEHGVTIALDLTYTFQAVVGGGLEGPLFRAFSDESDIGNTVSASLLLGIDTEQAGFWSGGTLDVALDARAGRSALERAGTVSAIANDALFPNVVDRFDDEAFALTQLAYTHEIAAGWSVFGGLLNTAEGDANEIAGSALSNEHFLNSALLYSLVEDATVPHVALGGGVVFEPSEHVSGSLSVFGSSETAGEDPFEDWEGTTFSTEWTLRSEVRGLSGAQTYGFLYGIDASRTDIAADPRHVLGSVLLGVPVPTTEADTWAFYYNAHQLVVGDESEGWGPFLRFGLSDGDPNPVQWHLAGGLGGRVAWGGRSGDRWGAGAFWLEPSDEDLLRGLGIGSEIGGEAFYDLALTRWLQWTFDVQVIDSALPAVDTTWVLGTRFRLGF